jgi:hypothetical protein
MFANLNRTLFNVAEIVYSVQNTEYHAAYRAQIDENRDYSQIDDDVLTYAMCDNI